MTDEPADSFNAKVVCSLSPLGLGDISCDANVELGPYDTPEAIIVRLPVSGKQVADLYSNRSLQLEQYFGEETFEGQIVETGTRFRGVFAGLTGVWPVGVFEGLDVTCSAKEFEFQGLVDASESADVVVYRLANVPLSVRGDIGVVRPARDDPLTPLETDYFQTNELAKMSEEERKAKFKPGWQFTASRINFKFTGRDWSLDQVKGQTTRKGKMPHLTPMVTATLTTEIHPGTEVDPAAADQICDLLTFAFRKQVCWVSCSYFSRGQLIRSECRPLPVLPYGKVAGALVDNWELGNVRQLLEECERNLAKDADWWHRSIGLLAYSRATQLLETRLTTLNTLVDRISQHILRNRNSTEIDKDLPTRIDRRWFRCVLHWLLSTLSPNWNVDRTRAVCGKIIEWNSRPSFPKQVEKACQELSIAAPSKRLLGFRHKLIHLGQFDKRIKTDDQLFEYLDALEAIVQLMMIRMLDFTGFVHLTPHAHRWQKVDNLLQP